MTQAVMYTQDRSRLLWVSVHGAHDGVTSSGSGCFHEGLRNR